MERAFVAHSPLSTPHIMQTDSIHVLMIILFAICRTSRTRIRYEEGIKCCIMCRFCRRIRGFHV